MWLATRPVATGRMTNPELDLRSGRGPELHVPPAQVPVRTTLSVGEIPRQGRHPDIALTT